MAKKDIRSKYIKDLMEDKNAFASTLEESTKEALSSMLNEKVNLQLRNILSESEDDSYEEEVEPTDNEFNDEPEETDADNEQVVDLEGDSENGEEDGAESESNDDGECAGGTCCDSDSEGEGNVWDDVQDCKDSDGEYDLRGKDINTVLKILQSMDPNDGVRIIKNDDDTATVEPEGDSDETEFVIDINTESDDAEPNDFEDGMENDGETEDGDSDGDGYIDVKGMGLDDLSDEFDTSTDELDDSFEDSENGVGDEEGDGEEGDTEFEVEVGDDDDNEEENNDEEMVNEGNVNLGYTSNYQKKTAMTMPHDKGEGEGDSRFDAGAPKGDSKRWAGSKGANNGNPYTKKTKQPVSEMEECNNECGDECIFEVEMDGADGMDDMQMDEHIGSVTNSRNPGRAMHDREQGAGYHPSRCTRTAGDGYEAQKNIQEVKNRLDAMTNENAQLRDILNQFKNKLNEAVVINASLAKATKLFTENSTTREEKINILNRFDKVQSINECKNLYNQISNELKGAHTVNNNLLNKQLTEAKSTNKNMIVETNMLGASDEIKRILDLQNRLENK